MTSWRKKLGVLAYDFPRFAPLLCGGRDWWRSRNRCERLIENPAGPGLRCDWRWTSTLHACDIFPTWGRRLLQTALAECPIRFAETPASIGEPQLSFIFAHGGSDRTPLLRKVIHSLFALEEVRVEIIVVDQSTQPAEHDLPSAVRYVRIDPTTAPPGWHKSWAYNIGARQAVGDVLVFHDGDICVPTCYGKELAATFARERCGAASIQRFLFYLDAPTTNRVSEEGMIPASPTPTAVLQNWTGGTIAVRRDAFFELGGYDEGFVDWGGEDNEFFDRCSAVRHCRFGFLPFVHLWHRPQPDRKASDNPNTSQIMPWRMQIPVGDRITELTARKFGNPQHPDPAASYKSSLAK